MAGASGAGPGDRGRAPYRTWLLTLVVVAASPVVSACQMSDLEDVPAMRDELRASLSVNPDPAEAGQALALTLRIWSVLDTAVQVEFTSGQRYDFTVRDDRGRVVWRWSEGRAFIQVLGADEVAPKDTVSYSESLDEGLPSGRYTVEGALNSVSHPARAERSVVVR